MEITSLLLLNYKTLTISPQKKFNSMQFNYFSLIRPFELEKGVSEVNIETVAGDF